MSATRQAPTAANQAASKSSKPTLATPAARASLSTTSQGAPHLLGNQSLLRRIPNAGSHAPSAAARSFLGNQAILRRLQSSGLLDNPRGAQEAEAERAAQRLSQSPSAGSIVKASAALAPQLNSSGLPQPVASVLNSPGQALDSATKSFMESRLGRSFAGIQVHSGPEASRSARSISADAFTAGSHIVFGEGQYSPQTADGRALLAHELTHAGQQADARRPLLQRRASTDQAQDVKKPAIVKIIAFEYSTDEALAYVSEGPDADERDGKTHKPQPVDISRNTLPAGKYVLGYLKDNDYAVVAEPAKAKSKDAPAAAPSKKDDKQSFYWHNPEIGENKKERKYALAKYVEVDIYPSGYKNFLVGDKNSKGTPVTTVELFQTAEALVATGVSEDDLRREEQRRIDAQILGKPDTPGDRMTWARSRAAHNVSDQAAAKSTRDLLRLLMVKLEQLPPNYTSFVLDGLKNDDHADMHFNFREAQGHPFSESGFQSRDDLWLTLEQFQEGLEVELKALATAVLTATEETILRVESFFVGGWGYRKNPAILGNALAKAKADPEIKKLLQTIHTEEANAPSTLQRAKDATASIALRAGKALGSPASILVDEKRERTATEAYDEQIAADREKLDNLLSEKSEIQLAGIGDFNSEHLFDTDASTAQFELSQTLGGGRNTILSAQRALADDDSFIWGADKIIKGEKAQLGIKEGTNLDRIVDGIVEAEKSKKSLWKQIWSIIDFLVNLLPIPPPAGVILRAVAAGINFGMAADELGKRGLLGKANLSVFQPSASALGGEFLLTAAGTVFDAHVSGLMAEEEGLTLGLRNEPVPGPPGPPESILPPASERPPAETPPPVPETDLPKTSEELRPEETNTPPPENEPPKADPPDTEPPHTEPPHAEPPHTEPPHTQPPHADQPHAEPPPAEPPKPEPPGPKPLAPADQKFLDDKRKAVGDLRQKAEDAEQEIERFEEERRRANSAKTAAYDRGKRASAKAQRGGLGPQERKEAEEDAKKAFDAFDKAQTRERAAEAALPGARQKQRDLSRKLTDAERQLERDEVRLGLRSNWTELNLRDLSDNGVGLYGELKTNAKMREKGFELAGNKTRDPAKIRSAHDWDVELANYEGETGIDGIYKRKVNGKTEWWAGDSKTTRDTGRRRLPTGTGRLEDTESGLQLSDNWLVNNLGDSGLSREEQKEFLDALKKGEVKKFYADVSQDQIRFIQVHDVPRDSTQVVLGGIETRF